MHLRQNFFAVAPRWLVRSDERALSDNIQMTGAFTNTFLFKYESYSIIPCSNCSSSSTSASDISNADILLEQHRKCILLNW